ncbi:MAG TPA: hypothetical protein VEA15_07055 [Caulobacteraceae bacterium]|nr:hypothetical protein [Caulobacteraceae bacterium]
MDRGQIHYEVFARASVMAPWRLEQACEDRGQATELAEELLADKRAVAVRVTKEMLDPETMEFNSLTLFTRGVPEPQRKVRERSSSAESPCLTPQDLYASFAREKIGRVLEDWLRRNRATPFELLHRPDLVEKLEASGMELQHAIQKIAVPESQATGQAVHDVMRAYQRLSDQAIERVIRAGRKNLFPDLTKQSIAEVATRLAGDADRCFLLGGAMCAVLATTNSPKEKVGLLLDFVEGAPTEAQPNALVRVVAEQPLAEILASPAGLTDLLGPDLDLGANMAALVRLAAPAEVEALIRMDPALRRLVPDLTGAAARLGRQMEAGQFKLLGAFIARKVLAELTGPRRLRPGDAHGEIAILRALAMALTASAGRLLSLDEVQDAFVTRSKTIVTADFVETYLRGAMTAREEAEWLVRLCENVAGTGNKREAARWLIACVAALRFEKEFRQGSESPAASLGSLAALQRSAMKAGLNEADKEQVSRKLGEIGASVEQDARVCEQILKAPAPPLHKLTLLLRLAAGEAAPLGPVSEKARAESLRLLKIPAVREALAGTPEAAAKVRPLLKAIGLAA